MGTGDRQISHPEGAELQFDTAPADWFADRLLPWGSGIGTRVCSIVPTGYEAYVRVFHHAEERVGTEWVRRRWSEVAERTGRTMHPAVQFERFGWPEPPAEGSLGREEASSLVAVLRDWTETPDDCWHAIWHGYGGLTGVVRLVFWRRGIRGWLQRRFGRSRTTLDPPADLAEASRIILPGREYYLYRGPIDVVPRFEFLPGSLQTPNLWWPDDRAWFVGTSIDFDSTLVAGTRSCATALLSSDLECLEVDPEARLDVDGDTVNPRTGEPGPS